MAGEELTRVAVVLGLGILLDDSLTLNAQAANGINKALRSLGFVTRNASKFKNPLALKTLYFLLVRLLLEFASVVWKPTFCNYAIRLERVQNRFLRFAARQLGMPINRQNHDYSSISEANQISKELDFSKPQQRDSEVICEKSYTMPTTARPKHNSYYT
ncbi:uncharacterized protein LOC117180930 [Belonocnema kinseyi]|uniref:uncharacterized protein LOC117180930 n=1 Tax=Belonocnema kinseyi TaxID=2817044 RepID=UPI00143D362C|nr:uncharacterized protein LOC117180930 [Belonocnema kinseyi]